MSNLPHLAVTAGEPAGIGPDLCAMLARHSFPCRLTVLGDAGLIAERAAGLGIPFTLHEGEAASPQRSGHLHVLHHPVGQAVMPGRLDRANARHVLALIEHAVSGCLSGRFDALVTAPVHKGILNDAGFPFSGHTEFIAGLTGGQPVMMLTTRLPGEQIAQRGAGDREPQTASTLRVALATTHLPLRQVAAVLTRETLQTTLEILSRDLTARFGIPHPRITALGLNPHAGEGGHLGREEIDTLQPLLAHLRRGGMRLQGPLPADTAFLPEVLSRTDAYLAMYHDQGLPVLKFAGFGNAVNITLGLPILRTSVDHGTALELAGSGRIDHGSLLEAIRTAIELANHART